MLLSVKLYLHHAAALLWSTLKGSSLKCKACFKSDEHIHRPLILVSIKRVLYSEPCGSQCVLSVEGCWLCLMQEVRMHQLCPIHKGDVPLQLLLIRKSICVRHQIVYVVRVQVGGCVGEWVGLLVIHLSLFSPQCNMMTDRGCGGPAYLYCSN